MSVFATLRRKRDKSRGAALNGTVLVPETKSEPKFNSTPNLHKINNALIKKQPSQIKHKASTTIFYPTEFDDEVIVEDEDDSNKYGGFASRRSSSAAETETPGAHGSRKQSNGGKKGSSGSLRHFASMISMFGSLKRTKSSRKMAFGSSQDIEPEKREGVDFMRDRVAGKSPDTEMVTSKPGTGSGHTIHSTQSDTSETSKREALSANTEPGVRSSSSSSDDDERRSFGTDHFNKSTSIETPDDERRDYDYTTTKTEEELKRTKITIQGIKKFNMEPKKGIEYLVEHDILQNTPDDVAKFLKFGEGLSKTAIGKYLGEHIEFNEDVLQAFLDLHNFKDLILVQALREFLWSFRLPGESQKIDRMMEAFAKRYCNSNPGIFGSTDTCFLLSYSVIMLNTTLHNPSVKDKPTVERFIQMNRDVDCGKSLNRAFLVHLYNSILTEPFKIPPEDANDLVLTFFNPNIEGWLWKQGGYKTWKRRWFILSNNCLYYFKFTTDKSPRGIIPLENVNAKEVASSKSNELFPFILYKKSSSSMPSDVIKTCKTLSNGNTVLSQYHTITVASINLDERRKWVQSINQNNSNSDFYDVLTMKKRNLEAARHQQSRGKRAEVAATPIPHKEQTPRRVVRKSLISQPSTAPGFEYKDKLPPELLVPAGPQKDPHNYFSNHHIFSSAASISSGSAIASDSTYGSFSDISRSRSESRIMDCANDGSMSSVDHETGSLGSQGAVGPEDRIPDSFADILSKDSAKFDLSKKLSVIEESQNQSDRSSSSSSANTIELSDKADPICLGYRKLSEENFIEETYPSSSHYRTSSGSTSSDSATCDNFKFMVSQTTKEKIPTRDVETTELAPEVHKGCKDESASATSSKYSRSGSIESDV